MPESILIVDDDPVQRRLLNGVIAKMGFNPIAVAGGREALDLLDSQDGHQISAMILDLIMPEMTGIEVLGHHMRRQRQVPVIVQTAQGGIETVVGAMRAGAFDFVVKPVSPERLQVSISNALKIDALTGEIRRLQRNAQGCLTFTDIISTGPAMEQVLKTSEKAARSQIPVLIEGESGVGKELIARAIQGSSDRSAKPFITVNCGALPENLAESILFGHEKGSFTGASEKHIGKFREADGGTLFLDEIGELPLDVQVKLLRALQEGEIDPVGGRKPVKIDIRLISATNRDLLGEVKKGRFREDLYYRLSVLPLTVPPLRDRREDISALAQHFMNRFAIEENRSHLRAISPDAMAMLSAYDWPGNIRQLENAIFRAVVLSECDMLTPEEFPQIAAQMQGFELPSPAPSAQPDIATRQTEFEIAEWERDRELQAQPRGKHAQEFGLLPLTTQSGQVRQLEDIEAEVIRFAIQIYRGKMSEVARRLGIGRSTLYRKLREYDLIDRANRSDAA
jgi:DNA-binding NtrC family response regulator